MSRDRASRRRKKALIRKRNHRREYEKVKNRPPQGGHSIWVRGKKLPHTWDAAIERIETSGVEMQACGCSMCANPRKEHGQDTRQEQRHEHDTREQLRDLDDD